MKITRRTFLKTAAVTGVAAVGIDALLIEPGAIEYTRHVIGAATPENGSVTFIQLSDLHLCSIGGTERELAEKVNELHPDFIIITGDAVDTPSGLEHLDTFMALLAAEIPKYAILGNWEHWGHVPLGVLGELYRLHNCELLVNTTITYKAAGIEILITGLDDLVGGTPNMDAALADVSPGAHHMLLAHCPAQREYFFNYKIIEETKKFRITKPVDVPAYSIRYIFSGHTHGGQVNVFGMRPFLPKGSGKYVEGWYTEQEPKMYVSRGIGTSIAPVRFCAPPEVAIFTMNL